MPLILGTNSIKDTGFDVANSLRFNDGSSDHLTRTPSSDGSRQKWTWSGWVKRGTFVASQMLFGSVSGDISASINFRDDQLRFYDYNDGTFNSQLKTNRLFRDVSAWYHIVVAYDTTQGTAANRIKFYVNGVQETSFATSTYPSEDFNGYINESDYPHYVGSEDGSQNFFDGYMAEVCFINNQQLDATSFGEFDDSGIWKPIDVSDLTFGTNGFYLDFETDGTSTAFVDSGPDARAVSVTGGVDHSFTQAKFGGSSIFFDGTNDSLDIADSTDFDFGTGNFTFEFWVYKTASGKAAIFETRSTGDNNDGFNLEFNSTGNGALEWYDPSIASGDDLPKDGSAISLNTWTHFAIVRNGSSCKMYRDGTAVGTEKDVGTNSQVSDGTPTIGESSAGANDFQGFLDEIRLSSTARYTGNFTAPSAAFTSDSDTVFLIQSKASNLIGGDKSGTGSHFTSSGLTSIDQSIDTCTNNFATMNPLDNFIFSGTFSEGNLKVQTDNSSYASGTGTIGLSTGKWYWEIEYDAKSSGSTDYSLIGILGRQVTADDKAVGDETFGYAYYSENGEVRTNNANVANWSEVTYTTGDIVGVALDLDNSKLYFSKNGTFIDSGDPTSGSTGTGAVSITAAASTPLGVYFPAVSYYDGSTNGTFICNFGSPPVAISSGNTDGNGFGNFEYAVPSGYFALCTKNLAENG